VLLSSARLILPVAAVLAATAATAGPAVAATPARPAISRTASATTKPVTFKWHPFTLKHGWRSASNKNLVTGTPAWAERDGVVYLRGAIAQSNPSGSTIFATLPSYARPPSELYIQVYTQSEVPGILYISPGGALEAYNGNSHAFTSLAAVSFPLASIKSHQVKLLNGWQSSQSQYDTGNPSYAISNGVVYLSGSLHSTGNSVLAFILPKAARPTHTMAISMYTLDGFLPGQIEILPQGEVDISGKYASGYTSLAGISFPVARTKWQKFKLLDGWQPSTGDDGVAPGYAVVNGVVYLHGAMKQSPAGNGLWTDLPAAARSTDVLSIEVMTTSASTGGIAITSRLAVVASMPPSNSEALTSLAGIAYPPSS
jgi:hypothetical protein